MPKRFRIAVILEIETDDPRLSADACNNAHESAAATAEVRRAILRTLPGGVKRVVAVTGPEMMKLLLRTHETAAEIAGVADIFSRPPRDYEPPDGR